MRVLWDALQEEKKVLDVSGEEPQLRQQWNRDIRARIPGHKLRRGAPKMQLRPDEENKLELVWPAALRTCGIEDVHLMCCALSCSPTLHSTGCASMCMGIHGLSSFTGHWYC